MKYFISNYLLDEENLFLEITNTIGWNGPKHIIQVEIDQIWTINNFNHHAFF